MKKLAFVFVAGLAMTFASCGNKTEQAAATDTTSVDTTAIESVDSAATDSAAMTDTTAVADTTSAPVAQ